MSELYSKKVVAEIVGSESDDKFGKRAGLNHRTVYRLRKDNNYDPRTSTLWLLAEAGGLHICDLFESVKRKRRPRQRVKAQR